MRAKAECKSCGGIQDATRNEDNESVYVCRCCYAVTPRRVNNCKKRNERKERANKLFEAFEKGEL